VHTAAVLLCDHSRVRSALQLSAGHSAELSGPIAESTGTSAEYPGIVDGGGLLGTSWSEDKRAAALTVLRLVDPYMHAMVGVSLNRATREHLHSQSSTLTDWDTSAEVSGISVTALEMHSLWGYTGCVHTGCKKVRCNFLLVPQPFGAACWPASCPFVPGDLSNQLLHVCCLGDIPW
jgi:hypothetical protein